MFAGLEKKTEENNDEVSKKIEMPKRSKKAKKAPKQSEHRIDTPTSSISKIPLTIPKVSKNQVQIEQIEHQNNSDQHQKDASKLREEDEPKNDANFEASISDYENPFSCNMCKQSFLLPIFLENHVEIFHRQNDLQKQDLIKKHLFELLNSLDKKDVCIPNESVEITNNNTKTSNSNNKTGQIKRKEVSKSKESTEKESKRAKYSCKICDRDFKDKSNFKRHVKTCGRSIDKIFKCDECDSKFTAKHYVSTHKNAVHSGRSFQCTFCDKSFTKKGNLNSHVRKFHANGK